MIRKQNSTFLTAFTSEANQHLKNTDCFAHVELDGYACYVVADGIDDNFDAKSAKICVDSVITAFTEAPSMSKKSLKKYIDIANETLIKTKSRRRLKASVMIIVHNYTKMRYAQAGNVRFKLYRGGFLKEESKDQSLSMDMVISEKLRKDKLKKHEERNNLYTYIGQRVEFAPFISKKIKLLESDAIAIYTRGYWENVDDGEILDIYKDASDKPEETINTAEDVLLSKQPKNLTAYTFVTIFVNKTFVDPNKKRRIKRIIMIMIPILIAIITVSIIFGVMYNKRKNNIELMNENFTNTIEYINDDNFIKAKETCTKTIELAKKLKKKKISNEASEYLRMIESIINGDDNLANGKYKDAEREYLNALDRSRYADKMANDYIEERLKLTADYISVYDLIALGDTLSLNMQKEEAEKKYLEAKALASKIYFDKGRENAISALEKLYVEQKDEKAQEKEESDKKQEEESSATKFLADGDKAFSIGDYESALVYYTSAQKKYDELGDIVNSELVAEKIKSTQNKLGQTNTKREEAISYVRLAENSSNEKDYVSAKKYYLLAKDIYASLKDDEKVAEINRRIEIIDLEKDKAEKLKALQEKEQAKNNLTETTTQITTEQTTKVSGKSEKDTVK